MIILATNDRSAELRASMQRLIEEHWARARAITIRYSRGEVTLAERDVLHNENNATYQDALDQLFRVEEHEMSEQV